MPLGDCTNQPCSDADVPRVGIFWGTSDERGRMVLITDCTMLDAAEPYGVFLTHPRGHYEVWEHWRSLGTGGLARRGLPAAIAWHEYEDWPRGRVVLDTERREYVVYADRRLQTQTWIAELIRVFRFASQRFVVRSDAHYRTR